MRLGRLRKLADPKFWPQIGKRVRALADRSGLVESHVATDVARWSLYPRERTLFSADGERPLRILLAMTKFDYGSRRRGVSYEYTHMASTLIEAGYEVIDFDFLGLANRYGARHMNEMLRECALRTVPDLAFFVLFTDEIEPASVHAIRTLGIPTFNWFCDDHWRYDGFSEPWTRHFDRVSTTSSRALAAYERDGHSNVLKTQWAFNPYVFRKGMAATPKSIDVTFVGQPHGDRPAVISALRESGVNVEAFGYGWPRGRISFGEMLSLFARSRIVLGLANDWSGSNTQIKGRDFEAPACGSLYLTNRNEELVEYLVPGREVVFYDDLDDLVAKCKHYLSQDAEREHIARSGFERVWNEHTYVHRFNDLFRAMSFKEVG